MSLMKRKRNGVLDKGNGLCQSSRKNTRTGPGQLVPGAGKDEGSVICSLECIKGDLPQGLDLGLLKMAKAEPI